MLNLLTAELHRVRRDPVCWLLLAASSLCGLFFCFECVGPLSWHFDDIFILPFYVVPAIFISLSIGREYSDGTLRNKIIVGKSKSLIFLSKVVFGIGISLSLTVAFLIPWNYLPRALASFLLKRSMRPSLATKRCLPV